MWCHHPKGMSGAVLVTTSPTLAYTHTTQTHDILAAVASLAGAATLNSSLYGQSMHIQPVAAGLYISIWTHGQQVRPECHWQHADMYLSNRWCSSCCTTHHTTLSMIAASGTSTQTPDVQPAGRLSSMPPPTPWQFFTQLTPSLVSPRTAQHCSWPRRFFNIHDIMTNRLSCCCCCCSA
jgi:hypothetical protein